jgi:rhodanese-related sulfurtransferase
MAAELKEIWPEELQKQLEAGENLFLLDVREEDEWALRHIKGAKHIPLGQLPARMGELDQEKEIYIICHSGGRSRFACTYLSQFGYKTVNIMGGMMMWEGEVETGGVT